MDNEPQLGHSPLNDLPGDASAIGEPHDERSLLTAFALGELNEIESADMENRLRDSADDRQLVGELARLGKLLRKVAAESPLPQPSAELRTALSAELAKPRLEPKLRLRERFPRRRIWLPLSLAASLAIVCGTLVALTKTKHAEPTVARSDFIVVQPGNGDDDDSYIVMELGEAEEVSQRVKSLPVPGGDAESGDRLPGLVINGIKKNPNQAQSPATVELRDGREARFRQIAAEGGPPGSMAKSTRSGNMSGPRPRANEIASNDRGRTLPKGGFAGGMMGGGGPGAPPSSDFSVLDTSQQPHQGGTKPTVFFARPPVGAGGRPARAEFDAAKANYDYQRKRYRRLTRHLASGAAEQKLADEAEQELMAAAVQVEAARKSLARDGQGNEQPAAAASAETYSPLIENPFQKPTEYPLSTFSIDVDTASYTNVRRFLNARALPPADAVRVEELINYFQFAYPQPEGDRPFSVTTDVADCPWNAEHRLLRVGLKGREVAAEARPAGNLVFLLDVSGSMQAANKLPLVKEAMSLLTEKLTENDHVAMITYAGESGLALPPTNGTDKVAIHAAIDRLAAGGSTNGGQGLQMAYDTAQSQFIKGGVNRVILATDGDFNVGIVNQDDLVNLVADKAKNGVYLTALGFGMGNLKDGTLEKLADKGNGNYAYIDSLAEARRVLVEQLSGTLVTIAKDVKLRIEFNPAQAAEYRLIGYENRLMPPQDFHDDRKDAGEIGAGHTVTALYEIVPAAGAAAEGDRQLKYQPARPRIATVQPGELATIQLRYKDPEATESRLIEQVVTDQRPRDAASNADFQFAAAVAEFGMLLRNSPYRGAASYKSVLALAEQGLGNDAHGYRSQFIELVRQARELAGEQ